MYIFSDIWLLLVLDSLKVLDKAPGSFYVTETALESPCYDHIQRQRMKILIHDGKLMTFSTDEDFLMFYFRESIKYPGLHRMDFAAIYHCMRTKGFLVERNSNIRECALDNGVDTLPMEKILNNIIKDKKYAEYVKRL
ncbi:MAG: hypothetical protein AAFQ20_09160 [Bacteroidota bacterium]